MRLGDIARHPAVAHTISYSKVIAIVRSLLLFQNMAVSPTSASSPSTVHGGRTGETCYGTVQ